MQIGGPGSFHWGLICGDDWGTPGSHGCLQAAWTGLCQPRPAGEWEGEGNQGYCLQRWCLGQKSVKMESLGWGGWMVFSHKNISVCPQETWYWDSGNVTEVVMSGVRCTGTELSLDQCAHHGTHVTCRRTGSRFYC